jgi:hypothetical protein
MYCMHCKNHIEECLCPDKEERLNRVADATGIVATISWCLECKRPQACCPHVTETTTHLKMEGRIVRYLDIIDPLTFITGGKNGEVNT